MKILVEYQRRFDELKARLQIDKHNMDDELIQQSMTYMEAGELHVDAASTADQAKIERDRAFGVASSTARERLTKANEKVTDKAVEAIAENDPLYMQTLDNYREACTMRDRCELLRESFKQRSYVLEPLCNLYTAGYFSNNAVVSDTAERREQVAESNKKAMAEKAKAVFNKKK